MKVPSANQSWLGLIDAIIDQGNEEYPRGQKTLELIGKTTKFDMAKPIISVRNRKLGYKFLAAEAWWIINGSNRVDEIAPYSKMISNFSDDGITFRGAYGPKIVEQLPWVAEQLKNDPNTRQAVLTIWRERPGPSRDYPCTLGAQWILRKDKDGVNFLHCQVTMRSSDAWLGVPYDWFNFSMISAFLIAYMRTAYPEAFPDTIHLGTMTFTAGSQHLYENHIEPAKTCTFESDLGFDYVPLNPEMYQRDPYAFLKHIKSLADKDPAASPFHTQMSGTGSKGHIEYVFGEGYLKELYMNGPSSEANLGFDAEPDSRGLGPKKT